jgi:hypothetical protein
MIKIAEVQYHIVRFDPNKPEAINIEELNALKYTMEREKTECINLNIFSYTYIIHWLTASTLEK